MASAAITAAVLAGTAQAEETGDLPLWEIGLGVGAVTIPDYPGSDQTDNYVLPTPYLIYRGEIFKADRDGMRAQFVGSPRFEFDLSLGATPPVLSDQSDARSGMPNLPPAVEIGPELRFHLARDSEDESLRRYEWNLHLPVRHSMTWTNGHLVNVGNVSYPHLNWKRKFRWLAQDWNVDADLGAYFNDRSYHEYFYQVLPRNATANRPVYDPPGGYGGWEASVFSSHSVGRLRIAGFVQFGSVGGAAFEESPLIRRDFVLSAGLVLNYVFWISSQRAPHATVSAPPP
jgi:outer membrane protein